MIRILTDSASDILPAEAEQLGVTVIPLNVTLEDGTVLRDGVDMTPTVYYGVMARCHKLPTTSQPSPELFQRFFLEAAAAGDEVVGIFLSHELSGTCQCARLAADMANVDNVLFVDSENVCLGESLLVRLAVQLRDAGKTAGQIAATLEHAKEHLHLVAVIDDLKYLRKGGRLPAAGACPALTLPCSRRSRSWAASAPAPTRWPVTPSPPARCSPSRPTCRRIWAGTRPLCARSAVSSAPTPAPARSVWPSSMRASPSDLTQSKRGTAFPAVPLFCWFIRVRSSTSQFLRHLQSRFPSLPPAALLPLWSAW